MPTGYHDVVFPLTIKRLGGRLEHNTSLVTATSGAEVRNPLWSSARWRGDAALGVRNLNDLALLIAFNRARQGMTYSFKVRDWSDFKATDQGSTLITSTTFQMIKTYSDAAASITRKITKPESGTITVKVGGVTQVEGVDYTIDYSTGIITALTWSGTLPTWSGNHYVHARFATDSLDTELLMMQLISVNDYKGRAEVASVPLIEIKDC